MVLFKGDREEQEGDWPDEELLTEVARAQDKLDREEQVAKASRRFWAEEILLQEVWKREKLRKELRKWMGNLLINEFQQVILMKDLLIDLTNRMVDSVEENRRKERKIKATSKKMDLLERIENRMDVVDIEKEMRIAKGKNKQWQLIAMDTDTENETMEVADRKKEKRLKIVSKKIVKMDTNDTEKEETEKKISEETDTKMKEEEEIMNIEMEPGEKESFGWDHWPTGRRILKKRKYTGRPKYRENETFEERYDRKKKENTPKPTELRKKIIPRRRIEENKQKKKIQRSEELKIKKVIDREEKKIRKKKKLWREELQ